jgi:hypothetical protein
MTHDEDRHRASWWESSADIAPPEGPSEGDGGCDGESSCRVRPVWVPAGSLGRALRVLRWEARHLLGEPTDAALAHDQVILADSGPGPLADPTTAVVNPRRPASAHHDALPAAEAAGQPRALLAAAAGRGHPELAERVRELLGAGLATRRRVGRPELVVLDTAAVTDWSARLVRVIANLRIRLLITGAEVWVPDPHPALGDVIDPATRWSGRAEDTGQR